MNWKFWEASKPNKPELFTKIIGMPTLARWYIYDTGANDPNKLAAEVGLTPVSEEGEATEESASDARSSRVEPYIGFIQSMSEISATTLTGGFRLSNPDADEEGLDAMHDVFATSAYLSTYAAFSAALELGLIVNPGTLGTMEAPNEQQ
jgi:hypothetical protein